MKRGPRARAKHLSARGLGRRGQSALQHSNACPLRAQCLRKSALDSCELGATSPSFYVAVVRALVQIAAARGWADITVTGTERFRSEAWRIATLSGLSVRGYRPTEFERQKLAGTVAAERAPPRAAHVPSSTEGKDKKGEHTVTGMVLEYGPAPYQFRPQGTPSYYVRIRTQDGPRVLWGKDLERALGEAKVTAGEEIRIKQAGRDAVKVKRKELDSSGKVMRSETSRLIGTIGRFRRSRVLGSQLRPRLRNDLWRRPHLSS